MVFERLRKRVEMLRAKTGRALPRGWRVRAKRPRRAQATRGSSGSL